MNIVIANINERRCNFCYDWIVGASLSKLTLNCCNPCLQKYYQTGAEVRTVGGQTYRMLLLKEAEHQAMTNRSFIDNLEEMRAQDATDGIEKLSVTNSIIRQNAPSFEQESINNESSIDEISRDYDIDKQHLLDFIKNYNKNNSQSVLIQPKQEEEDKYHQSCIFHHSASKAVKEPMARSMKKLANLEDYCSKLNTSRFSNKYKYYFDTQSIKKFKESRHDGHEGRQFGSEISEFNLQPDLSLNIRDKISRLKITRSGFFNEGMLRNQKLSQEEVKVKVTGYIEGHYHNPSLHKLMIGYVKEAYERTSIQNKTLELTSFRISTMDLLCYLNLFDFDHIQTIKLVNVGLTDQQLPILVEYIWSKTVETLVLTGNKLTESSLEMFLNKSLPYLKEIYLGKNRINKCRVKENITELRSKFVLYL